MPTKGERSALLFLAAVALLGAGTRVYRARQTPVEAAELDRQIEAVDASREDGRGSEPGVGRRGRRRPVSSSETTIPVGPVDLDIATAADIERLPGIGPALAKRITADRDAHGAFGCLAALDSVKGIGPAMLGRLDSLVVFSGAPRPACASAAGRR